MVQWLEDLLQESADRDAQTRLQFDRLKADQALGAIGKLEADMAGVNALADEEIKLIENYRKAELERLEKKRAWLAINLEGFLRKHNEETGDKSLRLPHGNIGLRKQKDRYEITDPDVFAKVADRFGLWRLKPEQREPDMQAIAAAMKIQKSLPGIRTIPGSTNFNYSTNGGSNGKAESAETE